jgi:hypothetical protein
MGSGKLIKRAIDKYGNNNFYKELICESDSRKYINEMERFFIKYYDSTDPKIGYNIAKGGDGGDTYSGIKERNPEQFKLIRRKISEKGSNRSKEYWEMWAQKRKGRKLSQKTKDKISKGNLGKRKNTKTPQYIRDKISKSMKNKIWITNNIINKRINETELNQYILNGWIRGRSKSN